MQIPLEMNTTVLLPTKEFKINTEDLDQQSCRPNELLAKQNKEENNMGKDNLWDILSNIGVELTALLCCVHTEYH